jgi:hypothetical protein
MTHKNPQRIDLLRKVYSKSEYIKVIDTEFNQLGQLSVEEEEAQEVTVDNEQVPAGQEINSDLPAIDGTSTDGSQIVGPGLSTNSNASSGGSTVVGGASSGGGGGY